MKSLLLFALTTVMLVSVLPGQDFSEVKIEAHQVRGNVYMLIGQGGNIGVLTGKDGAIMVDNQFAPLADKIKAAIAELTDLPVTYVLNTHHHGDHAGGNEEFSKSGGVIIAHENVRKRLSSEQFQEFFDRTTPPKPEGFWPVITFQESIRLHFNGEDIDIIHGAPAHTDGDAVIFFRKANVIHMGDVFVTYGYPFLDADSGGSIDGFIEFLDMVIDLIDDETIVIPGHGALSKKSDVVAFRNRLNDIRYLIVSEMNQGATHEEIVEKEVLKQYEEEWGGGFIKAKDFILLITSSMKN